MGEAASPPPSMRLHLSSLLVLPSSSTFFSPPLPLLPIISISLLLLPKVSALPHLAPDVTPPAPCGCITEEEASSLPEPLAKIPQVSVSECHQHCSDGPFFTFPTSHGSCVCGLSISSPRPCSWTQWKDFQFSEVEVFCLSTPPLSVSNSLLVAAPPDY